MASTRWSAAADTCPTEQHAGGRLCTREQIRRYCQAGSSLTAISWLAEGTGAGEVLVVARTDCDEFDGVSAANTPRAGFYCCLEWMTY